MSGVGLSMPISVPGLGSMMPSLTGGAGGAAGPASGTSNNGIAIPISTPFNFDGSGWVVNFGNGNTTETKGNSGANATQQSATPTATGSSAAAGSGAPNGQPYMLPTAGQVYAGGGGMPPGGGLSPMVLIVGVVGVMLLMK